MRDIIKQYLESLLLECGCAKVFVDPKDTKVAKPAEWAMVDYPDADDYVNKNNQLMGYEDVDGQRNYYYKKAEVTLRPRVSITSSNMARSVALTTEMLLLLKRRIIDAYGFNIELTVSESNSEQADTELNDKNKITISFIAVGGLYFTRKIKLIESIELEKEINRR